MSVTPEPDRTMAIFTQPDVPSAVRTYYEHCAINTFSISRQYNKTDAQPPQFQDIWTEKTYFLTEEAFPTVLRRSEVIDVRVAHVSPVEGAIQDLEQKTKELVALNIRYSSMYETGAVGVQTNHLAASLNNVVDAPAPNIKTYREAFLNSDFISQNAQQIDLIQKLRDTIDEHVRPMSPTLTSLLNHTTDHIHRRLPWTSCKTVSARDGTVPPNLGAALPPQFCRRHLTSRSSRASHSRLVWVKLAEERQRRPLLAIRV